MSEVIFRVGAYSRRGLNRGEVLFKSTRREVYHMLMRSERVSNIPKTEAARKGKTLMYFDPNVNRDGMKEGKVARQSFASNVSTY